MEEAHPMDGNDSDYDPKKETKKEVTNTLTMNVSNTFFVKLYIKNVNRDRNGKKFHQKSVFWHLD